MSTGALLIWLAEVWLYVGAVVAVAFLMIGIGRIDENARGSYTFRPLLVPGVLLIWPVVLWRWASAELLGLDAVVSRDRPLRDAHRQVWIVLAVLIPLLFIVSLAVRQSPPKSGSTAVQINPTAQ
jgi:hypothetical protein